MSNSFQTCLKGFKLKELVVEPKMAQLVEPDEESVDPQFNQSRVRTITDRPPAQPVEECKKPSLSLLKWLFNMSRLDLN